MKKYLYIGLALLLSSCGANYHMKRSKHHLNKAIAKGAEVRADTVYITKEVIRPEVKTDTIIELISFNLQDTIFIDRERVKVKVKIDTLFKEIFVEAKCVADTVRIEVPVSVTTGIHPKNHYFEWLVGGILIGWILIFAVWVISKRLK